MLIDTQNQKTLDGRPLTRLEKTYFIQKTVKVRPGYYRKCFGIGCKNKVLNAPRHAYCLDCILNFYLSNTLIADFCKIEVAPNA